MLNARVLALGVLADQDGIDIVVGGLEAGDGAARTQVGEEVEGTAQGEVERDMALAYGGGKGTLEGDLVLLDVLDGDVGDGGLTVLEDGGDVDGLPGDGGLLFMLAIARDSLLLEACEDTNLGGRENVLDGLGNLRTDTVTLNQTDKVVALCNPNC